MKNNNQLNAFPYVDEKSSDTKWNKNKFAYRVTDQEQVNDYLTNGHLVKSVSDMQEGYRFNTATIALQRPNEQKEYTNKITLSKPSAEVVCIRKVNEEVQVCLAKQPRTPYQVEVEGKTYARFFIEQSAGLVENGETFEEAAKREVREETGYEVQKLERLIKPYVCRHVSYADETSVVFVAYLGEFKGQELDENEDIKVVWYPVSVLEKEFEDYLEGRKEHFFGYDMPEMTILGLQRFFIKLKRGEII